MDLNFLANDTIQAAFIGFGASVVTLLMGQRMSNLDQEQNQSKNFFFKDEADYRRILSWIHREVEDIHANSFNPKNENLRKSVIEYFLLLSSQYYRYRLYLKTTKNEALQKNYQVWEDNIRKHMDLIFYREAWQYACRQLDFTGEFREVIERLHTEEERKDNKLEQN